MKKLSKLRLSNLTQNEIKKNEQKSLIGGALCAAECPCSYAGPQEGSDDSYYGGSSQEDNGDANSLNVFEKNN